MRPSEFTARAGPPSPRRSARFPGPGALSPTCMRGRPTVGACGPAGTAGLFSQPAGRPSRPAQRIEVRARVSRDRTLHSSDRRRPGRRLRRRRRLGRPAAARRTAPGEWPARPAGLRVHRFGPQCPPPRPIKALWTGWARQPAGPAYWPQREPVSRAPPRRLPALIRCVLEARRGIMQITQSTFNAYQGANCGLAHSIVATGRIADPPRMAGDECMHRCRLRNSVSCGFSRRINSLLDYGGYPGPRLNSSISL